MQRHDRNEIIQAIIEQRFVPLRLVDGKLLPPPRRFHEVPAGFTPEQVQAATDQARSQSHEERQAAMERLRTKYAHVLTQSEPA
jgi:hypothetical protein